MHQLGISYSQCSDIVSEKTCTICCLESISHLLPAVLLCIRELWLAIYSFYYCSVPIYINMNKNYYYIKKSVKKFREDIQKSVEQSESGSASQLLSNEQNVQCGHFVHMDWNCSMDPPVNSSATIAETNDNQVSGSESTQSSDSLHANIASASDSESSVTSVSVNPNSNSFISHDNDSSGIEGLQEDNEVNSESNISLNDGLREWAIEFNVTHSAVSKLLKLLHNFHAELPLDARTLLQTKSKEIQKIADGAEFAYFGIRNTLTCLLEKETDLAENDSLELVIHFDGIPVYKSSSVSFWPILCSIHGTSLLPFAIAIHYSDKKPNVNLYLQQFCTELKELMSTGLHFGNKRYNIKLRAFIADAPAKSFVKQVKQHGGYYACTHCTVKGTYDKNLKSMSYNDVNASLRTNESFRTKEQPQHHIPSTRKRLAQHWTTSVCDSGTKLLHNNVTTLYLSKLAQHWATIMLQCWGTIIQLAAINGPTVGP